MRKKKSLRRLRAFQPQEVFAVRFTLSELTARCVGKRDRECVFRLAKEAAIARQDFETAVHLRTLQNANKPTRRPS